MVVKRSDNTIMNNRIIPDDDTNSCSVPHMNRQIDTAEFMGHRKGGSSSGSSGSSSGSSTGSGAPQKEGTLYLQENSLSKKI